MSTRKILAAILAVVAVLAAGGVLEMMAMFASDSASAVTCATVTISGPGGALPGGALDAVQMGNARVIVQESLALNLPTRAAVIAVATARQESVLRNDASNNVPDSLPYPHDALNNDLDSIGLFAQRPSQGWGTVAQIMSPIYAAQAFYNALERVPNWQTLPLTVAAQAVQHSGFPDAYAQWETLATTVVQTLESGTGPSASAAPPAVSSPSSPASSAPPAQAGSPPVPVSQTGRPVGKLSPETGAYVGTYSSTTGLTDTASIERYFQQRETLAGRKFAIQNYMPGWSNPLDSELVRWDIGRGTIPLISWNTPDGMSDSSIIDGSQDALITAQAGRLKALGTNVFLRFDWEMNGNWFPWDGSHNGGAAGGPAGYVAMWRHVHDLFTAAGATNVVWVWTPSTSSLPDVAWNAVDRYYPGDAYVDWVGVDDYNYGGTQGHSGGWNDFSSQLQPVYGDYADRKPFMVGEMGSVDGIPGHDKGQWITQMAADVQAHYPDIQALMWFDTKYDNDWRFDTSPSSLAAFKAWVAQPYYNPTSQASVAGQCATQTVGLPLPTGAVGVMIQTALAQRGKPYQYGATGPDSFDCSGLVVFSWRAAGYAVPVRSAEQMYGVAAPVPPGSEQPGDLVFSEFGEQQAGLPGHVMIVIGPGQAVEAPHSGDVVKTVSFNDTDPTLHFGRFPATALQPVTPPASAAARIAPDN